MITSKKAHVGLKKPCENCPFTSDKENSISLAKGRREEIINDLITGKSTTFQCHKTVDYNNNQDVTNAQACVGAVACVKKLGGNVQIVKLAEHLKVIPLNWFDDALELSDFNYELSHG